MPPRPAADRPAPGNAGQPPANRGRGGRGANRGATRGDNPSTAGGRVAPARAHHSRGAGPSRNTGQAPPTTPRGAGPTSSIATISPDATSTGIIRNPTLPDRSMFTIGKIRPNYGTVGRARTVLTNSFEMTISGGDIYHYTVDITPETTGSKQNIAVIKELQLQNPTIFTPNVVYDGQKQAFAARQLPLGNDNSARFVTNLSPRKVYTVVMKQVQVINTEILRQYVNKQCAWSNEVQTAIMALDIVIRMEPNSKYPYRKKAFYMPNERLYIGSGIELWRGIFQSVRPVMSRIVVNTDLATGAMFEEGPLIRLAFQCLGGDKSQMGNRQEVIRLLSARALSSNRRNLRKLKDFLVGVRISTQSTPNKIRAIKDVITRTAGEYMFKNREEEQISVETYFRSLNITLHYPELICVVVGKDAVIPIESAYVPRGQIVRPDKIPESLVPKVLDFSTKLPVSKLDSIKKGIENIQHGQSDYVRQFGLTINTDPLQVQTRVLNAPKLRYSDTSRQPEVAPKQGAWNMVDKKFFQPGRITRWVIVVFEHTRFRADDVPSLISSFEKACAGVGIEVANKGALVTRGNPQGNIGNILLEAGQECMQKFNEPPNLIVVILPETAADIYTAVKHFGDVNFGVATQCLKAQKCRGAKEQYWNNVMLKFVSLEHVLNIANSCAYVPALIDRHNPTIVMGADVIHPPPGAQERPSFTALVANVDQHTSKYVTTTRVQKSNVETITDMKEMSRHLLKIYMSYRRHVEKQDRNNLAPKRLIFYRDGVSEGQFREVLDEELAMLKAACEELKINPTITYIISAKRHHNQLFATEQAHTDRSQNCEAGTVTDREISHPLEFDFILQSHAGIKGTSRPCHYNVIYDVRFFKQFQFYIGCFTDQLDLVYAQDFGFNADAIQALTYALCHVYAPSTRAVSIPAPVYYADRVCARAKHHYDPNAHGPYASSDASTQASGGTRTYSISDYQAGFKPLHANQQQLMYFLAFPFFFHCLQATLLTLF
ncbi:argonaute-like protein [Panaeolus papilionaceus]|nr:argonaute-like protein [Panaeolus papilionaceus]